jgi:uncharacterized protein YaaW (UPF0174 family)
LANILNKIDFLWKYKIGGLAMKFNIKVEYDPDWYMEDLDGQIKQEVSERITYDLLSKMGSKYTNIVEEAAKDIKRKIISQLADYYRDEIVTENLLNKIEEKINTKLNSEYVKGLSNRVLKEINSEVKALIQKEVKTLMSEIKRNMSKLFN